LILIGKKVQGRMGNILDCLCFSPLKEILKSQTHLHSNARPGAQQGGVRAQAEKFLQAEMPFLPGFVEPGRAAIRG
jgi:hypothetical protein